MVFTPRHERALRSLTLQAVAGRGSCAVGCSLADIRFTVTLDGSMLPNAVARHPKTPVPGGQGQKKCL